MVPRVLQDAKQTVASALKELPQFPAGFTIVKEGEEGDYFYIIRDGEVKCTKGDSDVEVSRRLARGDFFGELALLKSEKRQANVRQHFLAACPKRECDAVLCRLDRRRPLSSTQVITTTPTTVLTLNRATFERILG